MIEIKAKIHDKFSIEFKVGFVVKRKQQESDFAINTWLFVPNSLDITQLTYTKNQFYRDVKSNIRLITPIFLLREIVRGKAIPITNLKKSLDQVLADPSSANVREYEYQIKMFTAIFKSAMRDDILHILESSPDEDPKDVTGYYTENIIEITNRYRALRNRFLSTEKESEVQNYFLFGDEFMSNVIEQNTYRLIAFLERNRHKNAATHIDRLKAIIRREMDYKRQYGYMVIERNNPSRNRELVFRQGVLKKYIESDLFLQANKKKDGILVEQIYYSMAAGLSMIFATIIAFAVQQKYGNFTMPLFVALVVSYMLKDRIKDLMRYYFAHRLGKKYFDNKTTIKIKDIPVGWIKEGLDFITDNKVAPEVMSIRSRTPLVQAENRTMDEKIMLYRKLVRLDKEQLDQNSEYVIAGINDIMRLNVTHFIQKMDNPEVPLRTLNEDNTVSVIYAEKIYYMNIIMQLQAEDQIEYKRFRVVFSRSGISELQELK